METLNAFIKTVGVLLQFIDNERSRHFINEIIKLEREIIYEQDKPLSIRDQHVIDSCERELHILSAKIQREFSRVKGQNDSN